MNLEHEHTIRALRSEQDRIRQLVKRVDSRIDELEIDMKAEPESLASYFESTQESLNVPLPVAPNREAAPARVAPPPEAPLPAEPLISKVLPSEPKPQPSEPEPETPSEP